jgi:hypothetical protein
VIDLRVGAGIYGNGVIDLRVGAGIYGNGVIDLRERGTAIITGSGKREKDRQG